MADKDFKVKNGIDVAGNANISGNLNAAKYQTSAPSSPVTGQIWIDSDEDVPSVDSTLYYRWTKTMSGGETSLSGTDNNSLSLQYTPGYESVFINGVLQARNLDYTATSGSTIAGLTALVANDIVMVESIVAYSVGDTYTQTAADAKFATQLNFPAGAWTSFTPTLGNLTVGSGGSITGAYIQLGKTVHFRIRAIMGTSPTVGAVNFTLPITMKDSTVMNATVFYTDAGSGFPFGFCDVVKSSLHYLYALNTGGSFGGANYLVSTTPITWAINDEIQISGTYEAA
jgi:hypothetical protein